MHKGNNGRGGMWHMKVDGSWVGIFVSYGLDGGYLIL